MLQFHIGMAMIKPREIIQLTFEKDEGFPRRQLFIKKSSNTKRHASRQTIREILFFFLLVYVLPKQALIHIRMVKSEFTEVWLSPVAQHFC